MRIKFLGISIMCLSIPLSQFTIKKLDETIANLSKCPEEALSSLNDLKNQVTPEKIVIKPWLGRHNVYAIFMLPAEYKSSKNLLLRIPGAGTFCGGSHGVGTSFEGVQAKPGYYLIEAHLRTRTATWLIARGFANQLTDSDNWRLIIY